MSRKLIRLACLTAGVAVTDLTALVSPPPALEWSKLAALQGTEGYAGAFIGVAADTLMVAGGSNFPAQTRWEGFPKQYHDQILLLRDPAGSWELTKQALPRPMAHGVAVNWNNAVVLIGGNDAERQYADVLVLRLAGAEVTFESAPPLPAPVSNHSAAILDGVIYVAGGSIGAIPAGAHRYFWSLNMNEPPHQRSWRELETWPGSERMQAIIGAQEGAIFLVGGIRFEKPADGTTPVRTVLQDAFRFDPGSGWSAISPPPVPLAAAPIPAPAIGPSTLLILGGVNLIRSPAESMKLGALSSGFSSSVLKYHTITDSWAEAGDMRGPIGTEDSIGLFRPPVATGVTWWRDQLVIPTGEISPRTRSAEVLVAKPLPQIIPLKGVDYVVMFAYLGCMVGVGAYFSRTGKSTQDYFLGGQRIPWWAVGLSLFGTSISSLSFMAIPALVFRTDWLYWAGMITIVLVAPVVTRFFLPFFRQLKVTTAYEYLEKRFSLKVRLLGSLAFVLLQTGRMGIVLCLPAMALSVVTGIDVYLCIVLMGVLATLYTVAGGIEAVIWTDVIQVVVLLGGAIASLIVIVSHLPGDLPTLVSTAHEAGKLRLVQPGWGVTEAVLWVVVAGNFFKFLGPYTSDQTVIQRYLTTTDEKQARRAIWLNGLMSLPGWTLFFAVGTALWLFYKSHPELLNPLGKNDEIFPMFISHGLPVGVSGLVIAALFAASMSTLDSSINSMATTITTDFYRRFKSRANDAHFLRFARWITLGLGLVGTLTAIYMAWINTASLWDQYLKILGLFGGGLCGLFVAGVFTRRTTSAGILIGFVASALILYIVSTHTRVHFFLYGGIGIFGCVIVGWLASLFMSRPPQSLDGLTIYTISPLTIESGQSPLRANKT